MGGEASLAESQARSWRPRERLSGLLASGFPRVFNAELHDAGASVYGQVGRRERRASFTKFLQRTICCQTPIAKREGGARLAAGQLVGKEGQISFF